MLISESRALLNDLEVVRIMFDSSTSNLSDRVDKLDEPMNVPKGLCILLTVSDSHTPEAEAHLSKAVYWNLMTHLWHDRSSLGGSIPSTRFLFDFDHSNPCLVERGLCGIETLRACILRESGGRLL